MEHFCVHGPGDVEGRSLKDPEKLDPDGIPLDDELFEWNVDAYALDRHGRRLYDSAFFSRAKGRDKSGHAARFVLFEAFGPCRFAGFAEGGETFQWRDFTYEYEPGEPMGRAITYPFIRCLATEESQSGNTYDNVYFNLTEGPLGEGLPTGAAGLTRTFLPHHGEIRPSTAANASKDGGKETFVVFDETHLYIQPELIRMYATVRRNMAKRKEAAPWSVETSTMYLPGQGSVAEETHKLALAIREGRTKVSRLLFDHREAPADVDMADRDQVLAALREAYGPFAEVMDLERILSEIWDPRNAPADSRRYFFNQATSAADAWLTEPEWKSCHNPAKKVARKDAVTLGFDGSRRRSKGVTDATALIGCRVADGHVFEIHVWEQRDGPEGESWQVPTTEVESAVDEAFRQYNVVGFYADPAKWETYVAGWEAKYGARLKVKASRGHPIEWWMNAGRSPKVVQALEQFHTAVVQSAKEAGGGAAPPEITHDGSFALTRHVLNARRRPGRSGLHIGKEHPDSPRKIDAAVAAVLAWQARLDALAAGVGTAPKATKVKRLR